MANEFPLSLIIKAVDQATAPLRKVNERIHEATAPVRKLNNSFKALAEESGLAKLGERFGHVRHALGEVGHEALELGKHLLEMEVIGGFALYELIKGTVEAGAELGHMAQRVGLGVDAYARLRFAAGQAGVGSEEFSGALDKLNRGLGQAKAYSGPLYEFLMKVSPVLAEQMRRAKGTSEAMTLLQKAFEKVKDPAKRAAMAGAIFGRSSKQMVAFMAQGREETERQAKRFDELAGSQEEAAEKSEEFERATLQVQAAFMGLRNAAIVPLLPALTEIAGALSNILAGNRGKLAAWAHETGEAISAWVKRGGIKDVTDSMREWAGIIKTVFDAIGGLKGALVIVGTYMVSGFVSAVWAAGSAIISVGAAILATPVGWFLAAIAAIAAAVYLIVKYWAPIKKFFGDLWDSVVGLFEAAWQKIKPIVDGIMSVVNPVVGAIQSALSWRAPWLPPGESVGEAKARVALIGAEGTPGRSRSEAHVTVDFNNVPRGARVTQGPQNQSSLDLNLGYSLVTP